MLNPFGVIVVSYMNVGLRGTVLYDFVRVNDVSFL